MRERKPDGDEGKRSAPFSDMVDEVTKRRGEADDEIWEEFTEREYEQVDPAEIWEGPTDDRRAVDDGAAFEPDVVFGGGDEPRGGNGPAPGNARGEIHTVSKRTHCERCPHFSEPPEIDCSFDGSEIVELIDMTRIRVKGCPIAADQDGLDDIL